MPTLTNALRQAIMGLLIGDASLRALVAIDPAVEGEPAIFQARMQELSPVYPCLTYRIDSATPDPRHREPGSLPAGEGDLARESRFVDYALSLEAWDSQSHPDTLDAIGAALSRLLEGRSLSIEGGRVFRIELTQCLPDNHDPKLNARFSLFRFRFRTQRAGG